jgi:hypothetical protein
VIEDSESELDANNDDGGLLSRPKVEYATIRWF